MDALVPIYEYYEFVYDVCLRLGEMFMTCLGGRGERSRTLTCVHSMVSSAGQFMTFWPEVGPVPRAVPVFIHFIHLSSVLRHREA